MKKITFDKYANHGVRPNYPGYLLISKAHPTREFVVGRLSSSPRNDKSIFKLLDEWCTYDRATGVPLLKLIQSQPTREKQEKLAQAALGAITEEQLVATIERFIVAATAYILRQAA